MWPDEAQLILRKSTAFQTIHSSIVSAQHEDENADTDTIGGIIYNGKLGWSANSAYLEVIAINSGSRIGVFHFDRILNTNDTYISCVSEILIPGVKSCCLAVGLQLSPNGGKICIVSVQGSCILGIIDFFDKITTCHFVPKRQSDYSLRSLLRCFDGCLAVGTDQGKIILLDLCFKRCKYVINGLVSSEDNLEIQQCHIIFANADPEEVMQHHEQSKQDDIYFGIQLEVLENAGHVQSIVVIPFSMTLVVGLDDGRMVLYDLENLQAFHLAYPPEKSAPLLYLSYLEPADDPRACIYVWALHSSPDGGIGVMHSVVFQHKYIDKTETVYRNFVSCSARLTMPMFDKSSRPVACHSITKLIDEEEEQQVTLCAISWTTNTSCTLMVFDLNQWYKEQMPEVGDWRTFPTYTAIFPLGSLSPLDLWLDEDMIVPFNSIQRPEEHFYPNSLSFDVLILTQNTILTANWPGLQKLALDNLVKAGSKAILDPNKQVNEMINAVLIPQYQDFNVNLPMGIDLKREYLLTIALEYNCATFLKKVAVAVSDGSHIGSIPTESLGLSTVTDWIWSRARSLKDISNNYCIPLFDYSGHTIDCGMQKSLTLCTRQLRVVANLMDLICTDFQQYIPEHVHKLLLSQLQSIQLASDYQEATQWLLNVGLLPEGVWKSDTYVASQPDEPIFVPYPYHLINSYYNTQRKKLSRSVTENPANVPSPFIYIDMFIENSCDMQAITELWKEQGRSGLYPPASLQKMLRVLLIPDIPIEAKHILFVYLFMDINHVLGDGRYGPVVQNLIKFPAVFKMDPATIKITQSFWYFDHGDLETAIEELISPLSQSHNLKQWQRDFLITTLLKQESPHLALRILKSPGVPVDPTLELKTLLSNDLVCEAFKFQRAKGDKNLLIQFYEGTMKIQKRDLLLDLSLNEEESKTLIDFLETSNISLTENLHFVYLLQRSEFIDAVSLVDKLMKSARDRNYDMNVPREILTIYHTTLEPTSRQLTYLAYSHPDKFELKKFQQVPKPLSSALIRDKLDPAAGIYQRSILSVKEAGNKEMFDDDEKHERKLPFLRRSGLGTFSFVQKTQTNNVVYPAIINRQEKKRQLEEDKDHKNAIQFNEYEGPRKRRKFDESELPRKSLKDYDVSILTRFNPKLKPKFNFTEGDDSIHFGAASERTPEKQQISVSSPPSTLLKTPIVEKAHRDESPDRNRFTPQSILKSASHVSLPRSITPLSYASRKSFESEEKSIRFAIPGSSTDTTMNSSVLQMSTQTLNTTEDKTINESIVSKDEFFSPDSSLVQDNEATNSIKEKIEDAIAALDQTEVDYRRQEHTPEKMDITEGHTDLSFLADAPQPRPPIRSASKSSHSGSPRSSRSNSRSVSPGAHHSSMITRSKSREMEKESEVIAKDFIESPPESSEEFKESTTSFESDKSSTPIVPLSQKRSQKSLGRAVLEKNLKQQLMSDIFGEYSKTNQSEEAVPQSSTSNLSVSETDTSDVNFLSYEQSGVLTGDTLVDQEILKKMIGNETMGTSIGDVTLGDSTLRLLNASSTILSDSSNYEDSRDNLSVSDVKDPSVVAPTIEQTVQKDVHEQQLEVEKQSISSPEEKETEPVEIETKTVPAVVLQKSSEAISITDSEESDVEDYDDTETDGESDETVDKFANVSEDSMQEEQEEPVEEEIEEEYDDEEEEEEHDRDMNSSRDTSYSSEATTEPSPIKRQLQANDDVISIGSSSDDEENDDKHFEEIPQDFSSEPEPVAAANFIEPEVEQHYDTPTTLNQGIIMTHMETAHDIPETSYQSLSHVTDPQLYYYVCEPEGEHQPTTTMDEAQMSDLLYGEVEIASEKESDTDVLNLAVVDDEPAEELSKTQSSEADESIVEKLESSDDLNLDVEETPNLPQEPLNLPQLITEKSEPAVIVAETKLSKVKIEVIEVKKSDKANACLEIVKEVYDETVVQPNISVTEDEEDNPDQKNDNIDVPQDVVPVEKEVSDDEVIVEVVDENINVGEFIDNTPNIIISEENDQTKTSEDDKPTTSNVMETDDVPAEIQPQEDTDCTSSVEPTVPKEIDKPLVLIDENNESIETSIEEPEEKSLEVDSTQEGTSQHPSKNEEDLGVQIEIDEEVKETQAFQEIDEAPVMAVIEEKADTVCLAEQPPEKEILEPEVTEETKTPMLQEVTENVVTSIESRPVESTTSVVTPQPSTSNDKRKSIYPEDPLDKTSIFPVPDDGVDSDFLNQSDIYEKPETPQTLTRILRTRAQSVDQKPSALDSPLVRRSLRASSVPKSSESQQVITTTPKKSRRISVDKQSKLEHIEEDAPLDIVNTPKRNLAAAVSSSGTPGRLTRSASRRLSTEVLQEPTTPSRSTRASSKEVSSARIRTRRITDNMEEDTEGTSKTKSRRISASSRKSEEPDDIKSEISVKSTRSTRRNLRKMSETESEITTTENVPKQKPRTRMTSVSSSSDTSPILDEALQPYSQTRRLTRHQRAMMEKSQQLSQHASTSSIPLSTKEIDEDVSDTESIASSVKTTTSNKSKKSTASKRSSTAKKVTKSKSAPIPATRTTRSSSKSQQESEIKTEVKTRKRKMANPVHLTVIHEEDRASVKSTSSEEPQVPEEIPVKRTRKASEK